MSKYFTKKIIQRKKISVKKKRENSKAFYFQHEIFIIKSLFNKRALKQTHVLLWYKHEILHNITLELAKCNHIILVTSKQLCL